MSAIAQLFPAKPTFTEESIPDQIGKVFVVTGGNAGLGFELVKILYSKGAKVYMFGRSQVKAEEAIRSIKEIVSRRGGDIKYIPVDFQDLTTIKPAVATFAAQESKIDVLWNNAGIAGAPAGTKTKQNYELVLGTNCLGPYLLTKLLMPLIHVAAKPSATDSVRYVVFFTRTLKNLR